MDQVLTSVHSEAPQLDSGETCGPAWCGRSQHCDGQADTETGTPLLLLLHLSSCFSAGGRSSHPPQPLPKPSLTDLLFPQIYLDFFHFPHVPGDLPV